MREIPANPIGLTKVAWWTDLHANPRMAEQLAAAGVATTRREIPEIVGMGGCAELLCYTSPKTGKAVTVLVIPKQADVDSFAEDYYIFEGLALQESAALDWVSMYDQALHLERTA